MCMQFFPKANRMWLDQTSFIARFDICTAPGTQFHLDDHFQLKELFHSQYDVYATVCLLAKDIWHLKNRKPAPDENGDKNKSFMFACFKILHVCHQTKAKS